MSRAEHQLAARIADERGAVLVFAALFLTVFVLLLGWAIDTAIWYVHHNHLQTEADAAALAGGQSFQLPCTPNGTVDQAVQTTVNQYDGTGAVGPPPNYLGPTPVNGQLFPSPSYATTYSNAAHNVFSLLNQPDFENQSTPNDTNVSGSPCRDESVDVKLTETNTPALIPFLSPSYVNAQARVSIENLASVVGSEPFVEPLPTPTTMTAQLVDESNNDAAISPPVTLNPNATQTTWTGLAQNVAMTNSGTGSFPAGLLIAFNGSTTSCGANGVICYEQNPKEGVTYTRVWSNTGTPGQLNNGSIVAPQADDITVGQTPVGTTPAPCPPGAGGPFSNFVSSSTSCTVQVSATNVVFSTGTGEPTIDCTNASMTLTVGNASPVAVPCPSGSPLNGKTWTSNPITISPNSGPTTLTLNWKLTAAKKPGSNGNTSCTAAKPCTGSLGTQRVNSGAFDSVSAATSNSGNILGAGLTDASGNEILSVHRGTTESAVNITINVLGFANSSTPGSAPIELTFGGNQGNAAIKCGNDEGANFPAVIVSGCPPPGFQIVSSPTSTTCQDPTLTVNGVLVPCIAQEQPGNGTLASNHGLSEGMNDRMNGGSSTSCVNPSYWASGNSVTNITSSADPRLITLALTNNGALSNGAGTVPIVGFAEFYVTGWAGDPCVTSLPAINPRPSEGTMTKDDLTTTAGVLLGHFVKTVVPKGGGSGVCNPNSLNPCVPVLTK